MAETKTTKAFCWSCRQEKDGVIETKGEYHSGICRDCITEQEAQLKKFKAELVQKDREPGYSSWHDQVTTIRDVAIKANGETYFIKGFYTCEAAYNTCNAFNLVKQFLATGLKYFVQYGKLELLKKYDFWFNIEKIGQFYEFSGNCNEYSNAFSLRTLDINQIWGYVQLYSTIPGRMKQQIKAQIDKKLVFASAPEPHQAEKRFCYQDFSEYRETNKAKVTMIPELNPPMPEQKGAV